MKTDGYIGKITVDLHAATPADHWVLKRLAALHGKPASMKIVIIGSPATVELAGRAEIDGWDHTVHFGDIVGPYSKAAPVNARIFQEQAGTVTIEETTPDVELDNLKDERIKPVNRIRVIALDAVAAIEY